MEVLSIASELFPLVKTGGLADVAGALPLALSGHGVSMRTLLPAYPGLRQRLADVEPVFRYADLQGGPASLLAGRSGELRLFLLDAPHLFDRPGNAYVDSNGADWPDNWRRFAALGRAGADIAAGCLEAYRPDLLHAHDWQAALAPAYLRFGQAGGVPTVMTVHNIAFQGQFSAAIFPHLGLPAHAMTMSGVEYYGGVGFLKAGLQAADAITTVSPTYAQEIRTPEFGMGLEGLMSFRADCLHGIVNGIDTRQWNPANDPHLAACYTSRTLSARARNKRKVEDRFGLETGDGPLFCVISRLTWQKGMDILIDCLDAIVAAGARLVVLGSGDQVLESALAAGQARHHGRVGVVFGYDEPLSHLMQGGCDAILIPSRFEPCGLTQLYGLRYGCVPVVARTGGLADTVIDANEAALAAGVATGIQFSPVEQAALLHAIRRAMTIFESPASWRKLQQQGMKTDVSWTRSAARYAELYRMLIAKGQDKA